MRWNGVAVNPLGLLRVPLDESESVINLSERIRKAFAVLTHYQFGKGAPVLADQLEPATQQFAAFLGELAGPLRKCVARAVKRSANLRSIKRRCFADEAAVRRVEHVDQFR